MRKPLPEKLEACRITSGHLGTSRAYGGYGMFIIQGPSGIPLRIISSSGDDPEDTIRWEHVSVTRIPAKFTPNWAEMCFVKELFWDDEECVVQYHPPKSMHVNNHPTCLHLFRPIDGNFPMPPPELVGIKDAGLVTKEQAYRMHAEMMGKIR